MNAYQVLGIESDADERTIKRAYAALIKQYRPDTHPAEFAQVRAAYENVLHWLRENQQWETQQQAEESVAEPIATAPVEPAMLAAESAPEPETESVSGQAVAIVRNLISELLSQLEAVATQGNEQEILAQYREQSALMVTQNLDQQLEYEQALLYWVLATQHPSLLLFAEANKRYDWVSDSIAICRTYGDYAGYRLAALQRLSIIYSNILDKQNPFLQIQYEKEPPRKWLSNHYENLLAEELYSLWRRECREVGYEQLYQKLIHMQPLPKQMYWVDIAIGIIAAYCGWLFVRDNGVLYVLGSVVLLGLCFLFLPVTGRIIKQASKEKIGKHTSLISIWENRDNRYVIWVSLLIGGGVVGAFLPTVLTYVIVFFAIYFLTTWGYDTLARIEVGLVRAGRRVIKLFSSLAAVVVRATTKRSTNRHYHAHPPVLEKPLWQRVKDKAILFFQTRKRLSPQWIVVIAILLLAWIRQFTR